MLQFGITKNGFNSNNDNMLNFRKRVGKNLKDLRIIAGLSQEELANSVGVSEKTISYWENGHNALKYDNIPIIAKALGVPEYKLFVFGDLSNDNKDEIKNLLDSLTDKEYRIILSIIKSILMLR